MLGVINLAFRDLDYVEKNSYPRFELKLCKDFILGMKSYFCNIEIHYSSFEFKVKSQGLLI